MPNHRPANPAAFLLRGASLRRRFAVGIAVMLLPMLLVGGGSVFAYERSVKAGNRIADEAVSVAKHGVLDDGTLYLQKPFTSQELLGLLADTLALPV